MLYVGPRDANTEASLVVRDGLAARQWEAHLDDETNRAAHAWVTPPLAPYRAWRRDLWARRVAPLDPHVLLTTQQSAALWRQVVAASPRGAALLDVRSGARWAAAARRLLTDWNVPPSALRATGAEADFAAFLEWHDSYLDRLAQEDWLDEPRLPSADGKGWGAAESLTLLDVFELTPAQQALFRDLEHAGWAIEHRTAPARTCVARRIPFRDVREELAAAADWAKLRLERAQRTRLAIVVPRLRRQVEFVRQTIDDVLAPSGEHSMGRGGLVGYQFGVPLNTWPALGAALGGIELSSARATFATLSRWLRSPFFHADWPTRAGAAAAEAALRDLVTAQLAFHTAYDGAGLGARLERDVPDVAARLRAGLQEMGRPGKSATPDHWVRAWSRGLAQLGFSPDVLDAPVVHAWDEALARFAQLTPVVGTVSREQAMRELRAILDEPGGSPPLPLYGVHVLEHMDDVGPGYDAVWVTGLTDQAWPEHARMNPLLPRELQITHRMPWSTPADAMERARSSTERLLARTREAVLSWPATIHDHPTEPSPLIVALERVDGATLGLDEAGTRNAPRRRPLEQLEDPAPALASLYVEGGARTLDWQARCPIRAFCESRLRARPLERPARGLSARAQGTAVHRALELLMAARPTREALAAPGCIEDIRHCVERALEEAFGPARSPLLALFELETARMCRIIERFIARELERPAFRAARVEARADVEVGPWKVPCRIDRVDELGDGTFVLIDYKTGRASAGPTDWLRERLTETQLPLYALELGPALSGMLTIGLAGRDASYRGIAAQPERISSALRPLPEGRSWGAQIELWRAQIRQLVEEYVGGDTRIDPSERAAAEGAYAPLTRVFSDTVARLTERDP